MSNYKRNIEYAAFHAAGVLTGPIDPSGRVVEVVLTPGNGCRYDIVVAVPRSSIINDDREAASFQDTVVVSVPDLHGTLVVPVGSHPVPTYVREKMREATWVDAEVLSEFLIALSDGLAGRRFDGEEAG